jgi:hypothetical protein
MSRANKKSQEEIIQEKLKKVALSKSGIVTLAKLNDKDKEEIYKWAIKLEKEASEIATVEVDNAEEHRHKRKSSVEVFLNELKNELTAYENSDIRSFTISVEKIMELYNQDFSTMSIEVILKSHEELLRIQVELNLLQLMMCFVRGKLYYQVKKSNQGQFNKVITEKFRISPKQANRYIKFFLNVLIYPRLLICNKNFTEITTHMNAIVDRATSDSNFGALLKGALWEIKHGQDLIDLQKGINGTSIRAEEELIHCE